MATILTVDDSRAVRTIVAKQVRELGFEVDEAEDGVQGLEKVSKAQYDLILLDVTMPNLDGPGMLAKMREGGNKTPVIMLTSESKRSIVATAMKAGISDYILKPFKPEELRNKILAVLQGEGAEGIIQTTPDAPAPQSAIPESGTKHEVSGKQFVDILIVDDMENVHKKLRQLLPQHLTLNGYNSAQGALTVCRERVYRVIIVDTDIPDVNSSVLAGQLRVLQPHAAFVALCLRSTNDVLNEVREQGFDDVLFKPFSQETIEDFLVQYFDNQDFLGSEDNLIKVSAFTGRPERLEKYFTRLSELIPTVLTKVASACFDEVIIDVTKAPTQGDRLPKLLVSLATQCRDMGMDAIVVGTPEVQKLLAGFTETKSIRFCGSVQEARGAATAA
jgi:two-component system, cell cycle response regulator